MARTQEEYVTWTCDHCKRTTKGTHNYPKGWRHLDIRVNIEDSHVNGPGKRHPASAFRGDVCRVCAKKLREAAMRMAKAWKV